MHLFEVLEKIENGDIELNIKLRNATVVGATYTYGDIKGEVELTHGVVLGDILTEVGKDIEDKITVKEEVLNLAVDLILEVQGERKRGIEMTDLVLEIIELIDSHMGEN